jgi:hypothetical protein
MRFVSSIGPAVVRQELQTSRAGIDIAEPRFDRFDQHLAHGLARQTPPTPCSPRNDLAVTAILGERTRDRLAVLARNLEAVRTPACVGRHRTVTIKLRYVISHAMLA